MIMVIRRGAFSTSPVPTMAAWPMKRPHRRKNAVALVDRIILNLIYGLRRGDATRRIGHLASANDGGTADEAAARKVVALFSAAQPRPHRRPDCTLTECPRLRSASAVVWPYRSSIVTFPGDASLGKSDLGQ
jgi:hypothetical protein